MCYASLLHAGHFLPYRERERERENVDEREGERLKVGTADSKNNVHQAMLHEHEMSIVRQENTFYSQTREHIL